VFGLGGGMDLVAAPRLGTIFEEVIASFRGVGPG
jgi:hypothetical protein